MKLRNTSKSKEKAKPQYNITVIVELPTKKATIKVSNPCPGSTLRQSLQKQLQSQYSKIAYFQTVNADWLTDYKIQSGVGWIRNDLTLKAVLKKNSNEAAIGIDNYAILKCIGVGGFSKVYLVRDKIEGTFYAAKFIEKSKIKDKQELIMNQRQINEQNAFPFLVHMKDFIQTNLYFIMILDYCPGGELFHLQRKVTRFEEQEAKKYFIEVLLAIEYLHEKKIVYRDLKPQNIMLDLGGHIKIADFGLAKMTREKRYSFCGSLQYMSPQVLTRSGHSFEVDYYCLGVLLYEMTVGCPPFYQPDSSDGQTKQRILYQQVQFPKEIQLSQQLKNLIIGLLAKDPKKRLGHLAGAKQIKCHPWLGWMNRADYVSKKISMPFPVDLDNFNFDAKDITVSANRMLNNIRTTYNDKKNKVHNSLYNKKSCKVLSPYRQDPLKMKKLQKNSSTQKIKAKSPILYLMSKKKSGSNERHKDKYNTIKACYLSNSNFNLSNFFRFPTEAGEHPNKSKQRKSYVKLETESKQNYKREGLKKRKHKQQFTFLQVKRH